MPSQPIRIFYMYAREDDELCADLFSRMRALENSGEIQQWRDRSAAAGSPWHDVIQRQLQRADVIVALISDDFFASEYVTRSELPAALNRQARELAVLVPVLLRPTAFWSGHPLSQLNALPSNLEPVSIWPDADAAWTNVIVGLRQTIADRRSRTKLTRRRSTALRAALLYIGALALAFACARMLRASDGADVQWIASDLFPMLREVTQVTDDLAQESGHYLQHQPSSLAAYEGQLRDITKSIQTYNSACRSLRHGSERTRQLLHQLERRRPHLYALAFEAFEYTGVHCQEYPLPELSSEQGFAAQQSRLQAAWREEETRLSGQLHRLQELLDALETEVLVQLGGPRQMCDEG